MNNGFDTNLLDQISKMLTRRGQAVAVAESVTAGQLQTAFSLAEGAAEFFPGGITTYNINQKIKHLKVEPMHAIACNAVSPQVAKEMALYVARLFNADWGIGITGYASPLPGQHMKELYACFAISYKEEWVNTKTITAKQGDPLKVRNFYVNEVLQHFLEAVALPQ